MSPVITAGNIAAIQSVASAPLSVNKLEPGCYSTRRQDVSSAQVQGAADYSEGKVLFVGEPSSSITLQTTLQALGFQIASASSCGEALENARAVGCDVVLLDLNVTEEINGLETCREFRRLSPHLPILFLSIGNSEDDKVKAFDAGADDYVTKPFHLRELIARIRAAVRRFRTLEPEEDTTATIQIGTIRLDPAHHEAYKAGEILRLSPTEFKLLHHLMAHAGVPIPHRRLLNVVWGSKYTDEVAHLRVLVRQLRSKLEDDSAHPKYLLTERQFGYRFRNRNFVNGLAPEEGRAEGSFPITTSSPLTAAFAMGECSFNRGSGRK